MTFQNQPQQSTTLFAKNKNVAAPAVPNKSLKNNSTLKRKESGRWSEEEHAIFLQGLEFRPRASWKAISKMIQTRTARQTRTHAQKYFEKLKRHENRKLQQQYSMESAHSFSSDITTASEQDLQFTSPMSVVHTPTSSENISHVSSAFPLSQLAKDADCLEALHLFLESNHDYKKDHGPKYPSSDDQLPSSPSPYEWNPNSVFAKKLLKK